MHKWGVVRNFTPFFLIFDIEWPVFCHKLFQLTINLQNNYLFQILQEFYSRGKIKIIQIFTNNLVSFS